MGKELTEEEKAAKEEEFDTLVKKMLLEEGNKLREEEGLQPMIMEELLNKIEK